MAESFGGKKHEIMPNQSYYLLKKKTKDCKTELKYIQLKFSEPVSSTVTHITTLQFYIASSYS